MPTIPMSEASLKQAVEQYLSYLENQGKLLFQRNNSFAGEIMKKGKSAGYIKNNKPGAPDFYVFTRGLANFKTSCGVEVKNIPSQRTLHLELKATDGKQSPEQKVWQEKVAKMGFEYLLIRDLDELKQIIF